MKSIMWIHEARPRKIVHRRIDSIEFTSQGSKPLTWLVELVLSTLSPSLTAGMTLAVDPIMLPMSVPPHSYNYIANNT